MPIGNTARNYSHSGTRATPAGRPSTTARIRAAANTALTCRAASLISRPLNAGLANGKTTPTNITRMVTTTNNSTNVKPRISHGRFYGRFITVSCPELWL